MCSSDLPDGNLDAGASHGDRDTYANPDGNLDAGPAHGDRDTDANPGSDSNGNATAAAPRWPRGLIHVHTGGAGARTAGEVQ